MEADIKMQARFRVSGTGEYVYNLESYNEVVLSSGSNKKAYSCIGVWKIKQLKQ